MEPRLSEAHFSGALTESTARMVGIPCASPFCCLLVRWRSVKHRPASLHRRPPRTIKEVLNIAFRCAMVSKSLFTSVYIPKDVFSDGKTYPIMMDRTPYMPVAPYGPDYRHPIATPWGPRTFFQKEKFIFVYQDVRGPLHERGRLRQYSSAQGCERAEGHRREHRYVRLHRLADKKCSRQHREGRIVGNFAAWILFERRHDRCAYGSRGRFAARLR